jgi:transcriptional regulator with XRE-family HTH domain
MNETIVEITAEQQARLEADGWIVTDVAGFLGMTPEESAVMEIRFALRHALKQRRADAGISQKALADRLGTKQPRVAAFESGRESATLDMLIQALFAVGVSPAEIGAIITQEGEKAGIGKAVLALTPAPEPPSPLTTISTNAIKTEVTQKARRGRPIGSQRSPEARTTKKRIAV